MSGRLRQWLRRFAVYYCAIQHPHATPQARTACGYAATGKAVADLSVPPPSITAQESDPPG